MPAKTTSSTKPGESAAGRRPAKADAAATPKVKLLGNPFEATHLDKPAYLRTVQDRSDAGRTFRAACPRASHAAFERGAGQADPIDLLIASSEGRIPELVPIRYGRMMASPFAFYRGAAMVMADDLARTPCTGIGVQACGDAHLANFGAFATPERRIMFDLNDFDETSPAPWEWDLKRLAASLAIASRHNGHKPAEARAAALNSVTAYADRLRDLAAMTRLQAWYSFIDYEKVIAAVQDEQIKQLSKKNLTKALARDAAADFTRLGFVAEGKPRIQDTPPLLYHAPDQMAAGTEAKAREHVLRYRDSLPPERRVLLDSYEFTDIAIKVVGVGSVGTMCAVALFFAADKDPLFLQIKQARASVLEPYVDAPGFATHGERVVVGQRLMQASSDMFLGHFVNLDGLHLYVRQLRDVKISQPIELFSAMNMGNYARLCGWALARAHARSGHAAMIAGYIGKSDLFANAIADFAVAYAAQNERDHAALVAAVRSGRVEAKTEES